MSVKEHVSCLLKECHVHIAFQADSKARVVCTGGRRLLPQLEELLLQHQGVAATPQQVSVRLPVRAREHDRPRAM